MRRSEALKQEASSHHFTPFFLKAISPHTHIISITPTTPEISSFSQYFPPLTAEIIPYHSQTYVSYPNSLIFPVAETPVSAT